MLCFSLAGVGLGVGAARRREDDIIRREKKKDNNNKIYNNPSSSRNNTIVVAGRERSTEPTDYKQHFSVATASAIVLIQGLEFTSSSLKKCCSQNKTR